MREEREILVVREREREREMYSAIIEKKMENS